MLANLEHRLDHLPVNIPEVEAIAHRQQTPSNLVIITLDGNFEAGFSYVTAQIWENNSRLPIQIPGKLPPASYLSEIYNDWQSQYQTMVITGQRGGFHKNQVTNISIEDIKFSTFKLEERLNKWLMTAEFAPIDRGLRERFSRSEEIQIIIVSEDATVRRIPWHLWDFCKVYNQAEVALSLPLQEV